jgi:hypothetical protein
MIIPDQTLVRLSNI